MSTTQRELEELRKIREAERIQAEKDQIIANEKAAQKAKKDAFMARAAMFHKKAGPTDEEVRAAVQKESAKRRFGRELNRKLDANPNQNAFAVELNMKNKTSGASKQSGSGLLVDGSNVRDWELVEQVGEAPYYWNKATGEVTYELPAADTRPPPPQAPRPPPPPPRRLPGLEPPPLPAMPAPPPVPPPLPTDAAPPLEQAADENIITAPPVPVAPAPAPGTSVLAKTSPWKYVFEGEEYPYYWNTETNATTFDRPEDFVEEGGLYVDPTTSTNVAATVDTAAANEQLSTILWSEDIDADSGEVSYLNLSTGETRIDRPVGTVIVVIETDDGGEENWQECVYQDDSGDSEGGYSYYKNVANGEVREDRPAGGSVVIAESIGAGNF